MNFERVTKELTAGEVPHVSSLSFEQQFFFFGCLSFASFQRVSMALLDLFFFLKKTLFLKDCVFATFTLPLISCAKKRRKNLLRSLSIKVQAGFIGGNLPIPGRPLPIRGGHLQAARRCVCIFWVRFRLQATAPRTLCTHNIFSRVGQDRATGARLSRRLNVKQIVCPSKELFVILAHHVSVALVIAGSSTFLSSTVPSLSTSATWRGPTTTCSTDGRIVWSLGQ